MDRLLPICICFQIVTESQNQTVNVGAMIRRRTGDEKVGVRKAALQVIALNSFQFKTL